MYGRRQVSHGAGWGHFESKGNKKEKIILKKWSFYAVTLVWFRPSSMNTSFLCLGKFCCLSLSERWSSASNHENYKRTGICSLRSTEPGLHHRKISPRQVKQVRKILFKTMEIRDRDLTQVPWNEKQKLFFKCWSEQVEKLQAGKVAHLCLLIGTYLIKIRLLRFHR